RDHSDHWFIQLTVQDTGTGISSIQFLTVTNAAAYFAFTVGTTSPVVVTGTELNDNKNAEVKIRVTDGAGNQNTCDVIWKQSTIVSFTPSGAAALSAAPISASTVVDPMTGEVSSSVGSVPGANSSAAPALDSTAAPSLDSTVDPTADPTGAGASVG